ncbi:MAG TPA: CGNR zinc finger domain-containing protein [Arthrobacter sp.]
MDEFVGGLRCLDLVATVAERHRAAEEKLFSPEDLANWCLAAGLLTTPPEVSAGQLASATTLREAMFRLLTAIRQGEPFQEHDLLLLNDSAAVPPPLVSISAKDRTISRSGSVNSALSLMARECLELLGGPDLARLSWCADENCTRPFLDKSHGHRRRWCGMKGCGDRAKAAAYRRRVKTAGQGD